MQKLLSGWPVNLNDPKATIAMKLPVEVGISTILIPSAGSVVNQIAASEAEKAEEAAKQAPETDALEALGKDVQKLQA